MATIIPFPDRSRKAPEAARLTSFEAPIIAQDIAEGDLSLAAMQPQVLRLVEANQKERAAQLRPSTVSNVIDFASHRHDSSIEQPISAEERARQAVMNAFNPVIRRYGDDQKAA